MHIQHCDSAVDNAHVQVTEDVSDSSAAALVYFSKLCCLELDISIIEDASDLCHVLGCSVV